MPNGGLPFGTPGRKWNEDDKDAPITSLILKGQFLDYNILDLDLSTIEDGVINDLSPNVNMGILIDDYDIDYVDNPVELYPEKPLIRTKIGKSESRKSH